MLRHHAGKDADAPHLFAQLRVGHPIQFVAGNDFVAVRNSHLFCDGARRRTAVARDHHNADAGPRTAPGVLLHRLPRGIGEADQAAKPQFAVRQHFRDAAADRQRPFADGEDAQALPGHPVQLGLHGVLFRIRQAAKPQELLRRAFRRDEDPAFPLPDMTHHFGLVGERIFFDKLAREQELACDSLALAASEHRLFHRVVGLGLARHAHDLVEVLFFAVRRPCFPDGHFILRDRAGLIHAEDGNRAERLHRGEFSHQRVFSGQPPGAHGEEHREDDREFLRDHRHGQRDAGEDAFDQPVPEEMVGDVQPGGAADQRAQHGGDDRAEPDQPAGLFLQRRRVPGRVRHVRADLPVFGRRPDFLDADRRAALQDHGAGITPVAPPEIRLLPPRGAGGGFPDALGLAGQGGFVDAKVVCPDDLPVGRDFDALEKQHQVARDQIGAVDRLFFAVPDHPDLRRGKVFQGLERFVRLPLLSHVDADVAEHEDQHDGAVARFAQKEIDDRRGEQQQKHRLGKRLQDLTENVRFLPRRQFVFPEFCLQFLRLTGRQSGSGRIFHLFCHSKLPPDACQGIRVIALWHCINQ